MAKVIIHNDNGEKVATVRDGGGGDLWVKPVKSALDSDGEFLLSASELVVINAASDAFKDNEE